MVSIRAPALVPPELAVMNYHMPSKIVLRWTITFALRSPSRCLIIGQGLVALTIEDVLRDCGSPIDFAASPEESMRLHCAMSAL